MCEQITGAVTFVSASVNSTVTSAYAVLLGEPWLRWSLLQAGGLVVLVAGETWCSYLNACVAVLGC